MDIEKLQSSFKAFVSETKRDLKSYGSLFCAKRGYHVEDLSFFFDDTGLMPGVRVELRSALHYDKQPLAELEVALEADLNNIVFDFAYNARHKICADDSKTEMSIPVTNENMPQLAAAALN